MRLWKWLKLGFDQTFSGAWWKQLLWLTSVIVFFFAGMYILRPQVGISPQTENAVSYTHLQVSLAQHTIRER